MENVDAILDLDIQSLKICWEVIEKRMDLKEMTTPEVLEG
jgi:hypothetical protein